MVEWVETRRGIHAVGTEGEVEVGTRGWQSASDAPALPARVDAGVVGSATALDLPTTAAALDGCTVDPPGALPAGEHLLSFDAGVETVVRVAGPARVLADGAAGDGAASNGAAGNGAAGETPGLRLQFGERTSITLGFRDGPASPPALTVPPTPAGVATALSHFPSSHRTSDPRRSHPAYRDHPPLVEFGDEDVPRAVREAVPDTGIELVVPRRLDHLLVAAPLAYYLGASVSVSRSEGSPRLRAPSVGFERSFTRLPQFQAEAADLLRRVVFLDTLVRGLNDSPPARAALGLDPALLERPPDERLAAYADLPEDDVRERLPDWHLSTYVAPRIENARALPYLLDRLSLVYMPEATELDGNELLKRTLDEFYRGEVAAVDVLDPELGAGRMHAWLADGTPIDAFKTSTRAHQNRLTVPPAPDRVDVAVVLNDMEMTGERTVADIYREHSGPVVDVSVYEQLQRRDLADVIERPHDFFHFVGHCEVDGLCCTDGFLAISDLDRSGARAFLLNACGSYHQGRALVERGSVVGAVTLARVLDEQAGTVGRTFARLVARGFDVATATQLARRRVMMGKDYAVVGDGTFAPVPRFGDPAVVRIEPTGGAGGAGGAGADDSDAGEGAFDVTGVGEGTFDVSYDVACPRSGGRSYRDPFEGERRSYGSTAETTLDRTELISFLDGRSLPVLYDGDLRWPTDVAEDIADW